MAASSTSIPIASNVRRPFLLYEFMAWLQGSLLGHAMRESGVWTYGVVNLVHILAVATLFGSVLVIDLRLLGAWRNISLAAITTPTVPLAGTGFAVAATRDRKSTRLTSSH